MIKYIQNKLGNILHIFGAILLFLCSTQIIAQNESILDTSITYKAKNITLHAALIEIGSIVGYEFSYNSDLIPANSIIKVNEAEINLTNLLNSIIKDSSLVFKVADKQIVICKSGQLNLLVSQLNQENKEFFTIEGTIMDEETREFLPFTNVSVKGKSLGTISNEDGFFNLMISHTSIWDTLVFSYIGYKNRYLPINQLSRSNKIYLNQNKIEIPEAIIRMHNAKSIIEEALMNISNNYFTEPYQMTSFYREKVLNKLELITITEAVLDVYKSPYMGMYSDKIKLIKSRKNEYYSSKDSISLKLKGGLLASLYLDVIKNPSYFILDEYLTFYNYYLAEIVDYDNSPTYVIHFKPKGYLGEKSIEGNIYINTENHAIVAVEFNLTSEAIKTIGNELVVKKGLRTNVKPVSVKYFVSYRKINTKYFLNLVRGELNFKVKYKGKMFSESYNTVFEFATNDIDTVNVEKFKRSEIIPSNNVFIDENYDYDHQFWGEYNYISPDESLQDALIRIQKKIEKLSQEE